MDILALLGKLFDSKEAMSGPLMPGMARPEVNKPSMLTQFNNALNPQDEMTKKIMEAIKNNPQLMNGFGQKQQPSLLARLLGGIQ